MSLDLEATVRLICKALNVTPVELPADSGVEEVLDVSPVFGVKLKRVEAYRATLSAHKQSQLPTYFICVDSLDLAGTKEERDQVEVALNRANLILGLLDSHDAVHTRWLAYDGSMPDHAILPHASIGEILSIAKGVIAGVPEPSVFPVGKHP